jgi:hypothetical protein
MILFWEQQKNLENYFSDFSKSVPALKRKRIPLLLA